MARITICDRCGRTTAMDRTYIHLHRCGWNRLDVETISLSAKTLYLCGECSKAFKAWMKQKEG